ncbi:MAG: class I SAM-dependent methyltransferase [Syntrophales bacterium]
MDFTLHSSAAYHRQELRTLGWETTLCNTLADRSSPCRMALNIKDSYGNLVYDYLGGLFSFERINHLLEVGGGYGWLMSDFMSRKPFRQVTMIDISPHLLDKQKQALRCFPGSFSFREEDFLDTPAVVLEDIDLAVLNENIGDYPTITDLTIDFLTESPGKLTPELQFVRKLFSRYGLPRPLHPVFHINIGALMALEKLCSARVPFIFLSEHSCEAAVTGPYRDLIHVSASDNPECIMLKGHDEFTIRFSHLEKIGHYHGYKVIRGPVADYIPFEMTARLRAIIKAPSPWRDEDEIIRYFIEDLYKYEYLLLSKERHESG